MKIDGYQTRTLSNNKVYFLSLFSRNSHQNVLFKSLFIDADVVLGFWDRIAFNEPCVCKRLKTYSNKAQISLNLMYFLKCHGGSSVKGCVNLAGKRNGKNDSEDSRFLRKHDLSIREKEENEIEIKKKL